MTMTSICIDGFNLALARGSGIATYGRNLLENVRALGMGTQVLYGPSGVKKPQNVLNEAMLVDAERPPQKLNRKQKARRWRNTLTSPLGRSPYPIMPSGEVIWPSRSGGMPAADRFWAAQDLYFLANRAFHAYGRSTPVSFAATSDAPAPDIMHWTANLPLHAKGVANIYTFHDLIPLRLPHTTLDDKANYMKLSREVASRADHIAVVSETTRQDVIRLLGVDERRVTNTYQAVSIPSSLSDRPQAEVEMELEGVFNLGWKNYFLHFGAIEPKKNLGRIVEAYLASGTRAPLIIIGGRAWLDEGETALLAQVKRDGGPNADRIRQYDYMPFSLLISLVRGAKATLFPSLYEGFGLPVLESMALSTAVLTSTGGALPEVAGDAALIVDPYDARAIARGIQALDADADMRLNFETLGKVQAEAFSPAAYQLKLRDLYAKVVG
ncbi:glycosyltransferase involved in cell wall biosynthesis [Brevundimonas sp. SORGH_AS 993]|nr:glycosyltransferase involved in cell wall biosynthesis [Brevundimonas sp. SORGH_AS_0993]